MNIKTFVESLAKPITQNEQLVILPGKDVDVKYCAKALRVGDWFWDYGSHLRVLRKNYEKNSPTDFRVFAWVSDTDALSELASNPEVFEAIENNNGFWHQSRTWRVLRKQFKKAEGGWIPSLLLSDSSGEKLEFEFSHVLGLNGVILAARSGSVLIEQDLSGVVLERIFRENEECTYDISLATGSGNYIGDVGVDYDCMAAVISHGDVLILNEGKARGHVALKDFPSVGGVFKNSLQVV